MTFVLVHGTGHGGWCWKFVREILERQGHRVYTPTLTGCGERSHLLHPDIGLEIHIMDVVNTLECEELKDVVLVGHSYGGCVISGVADRAKERLRHLVYLDTVVLRDGESLVSSRRQISIEEKDADIERRRRMSPDGKYIVARSGAIYGIPPDPPEVLAWVDRRLTPHPLKSWLDPVRLENGGEEGVPRTFIRCTNPEMPYSGIDFPLIPTLADDFGAFVYRREARKPGPERAFPATPNQIQSRQRQPNITNGNEWRYEELKTGHDAMVTEPQACADLFLAAARSS